MRPTFQFTGLPGELRLTGIESHVSPDGAAWEMGAGPPKVESGSAPHDVRYYRHAAESYCTKNSAFVIR
ncbi:MAG: hypothetical protein WBR30_19385, partial [Candidatus Sulfotelmatobacter sp.]